METRVGAGGPPPDGAAGLQGCSAVRLSRRRCRRPRRRPRRRSCCRRCCHRCRRRCRHRLLRPRCCSTASFDAWATSPDVPEVVAALPPDDREPVRRHVHRLVQRRVGHARPRTPRSRCPAYGPGRDDVRRRVVADHQPLARPHESGSDMLARYCGALHVAPPSIDDTYPTRRLHWFAGFAGST